MESRSQVHAFPGQGQPSTADAQWTLKVRVCGDIQFIGSISNGKTKQTRLKEACGKRSKVIWWRRWSRSQTRAELI